MATLCPYPSLAALCTPIWVCVYGVGMAIMWATMVRFFLAFALIVFIACCLSFRYQKINKIPGRAFLQKIGMERFSSRNSQNTKIAKML
jgi:hypothetical protein